MTDVAALLLFLASGTYLTVFGFLSIRRLDKLKTLVGSGPRKHILRPVARPGFFSKRAPFATRLLLRYRAQIGLTVALILLSLAGGLFFENRITLAVITGIFALTVALVTYIGVRRQQKRRDQMIKQLPEAIEIIVRAARVGLSIDESFRIAGEEMPAPVGPVFQSMAKKMHLGQELQAVLNSVSAGFGIKDFHFLAVTLIVQQQSGGQYSTILQNLAHVLRARHRQEQRLLALTSEARLSAKAISLVTVLLLALIAVTNEAQMDFLLHQTTGRGLLLYALGSMTFGFLLISLLLKSGAR